MLKFDLTRKYLVGLLTLAMVFSLFALPAAADVAPIVDTPGPIVTGATFPIDPSIHQTIPANLPPAAAAQNWTYSNTVLAGAATADALDPKVGPSWLGTSTRMQVIDIVLKDSTYHVWYKQALSQYGAVEINTSTIYYLVTDSPTNWDTGGTRYVVTGLNASINTGMFDGSVLIESSTSFKIWYMTDLDTDGSRSIWYATSSNGYQWFSNATPALAPVAADVTHTTTLEWRGGLTVLKLDTNDYRMWMTGRLIGVDKSMAIYHARSLDGIAWTTYGTPPLVVLGDALASETNYIRYWRPDVTIHGGVFQVWAEYSNDANYDDVRYATSGDGVVWSSTPTTVLTGNRSPAGGTTTASPWVKNLELPKVVFHPTLGYLMYFYAQPYADASHWYTSRDVQLMYLPTPALTAEPLTETNTIIANTPITHTVTAYLKDQFGQAVTGTIAFAVSPTTYALPYYGDPKPSISSSAFTYTTSRHLVPNYGTDVITITATVGTTRLTATVTKIWTYTSTFNWGNTRAGVNQGPYYNYINTTHTVTVNFLDQNNLSVSATYSLYLYALRGSVTTTYGPFIDLTGTATRALLTYASATVGTDILTISGTVANLPQTAFAAGTKYWVAGWSVTPADAVNVMGAPHTILINGTPGDSYLVQWSTQFGSHEQPILVSGSAGWTGTIGDTGTATLIVKAEWPGKYFFDVTLTGTRSIIGAAPTLTSTTIKVAKSWAQLTGFDINPPLDINPITQVPTWDVHTVTVVVLGEYPTKYSLTLPNIDPPMGGTYVLDNGILWVIDAPLAGVPVGWDVSWNYMKNGQVDIYADRVGDLAYLPGVADLHPGVRALNEHQDGSLLTVEHDLYATSISDANGIATLTYHLELDASATWSPTLTSRTCTYYWPCFVDTITATAHYPEQALTDEFGYITGTSTKEWRDHAFKLVKYNGRLPYGDPTGYIPGAKFFLKRMDLVGTPTYVPPMPVGFGWTTPPFAPPTNPPGNAYIVITTDPAGVLTTDIYGEALWMHLPYGVYGLFEYSVPAPFTLMTGTLTTFTINADAPYWCGPDPKITTHYQPNGITPTGPSFYKLTWCGTKMTGVTFEVTNLDTPQMHSYVTGVNGLLQITLTHFTPAFDSNGTWYKVHEVSNVVLDQWNVVAVPDFYFNISATGAWNDTYYDAASLTANQVWGLTQLPWAFDMTYRHWVVDPKRQGYDLSEFTLTANPDLLLLPDEDTSVLTVTAKNQYGVGMEGIVITLTTNFGDLSVPLIATGPTGTATLTIFSDEVGTALVEATSGAYSDTVEITWSASLIDIELSLSEGWNLVGVPLVTNDTIRHLFGGEFLRAFGWDPTFLGGYYFLCSDAAPVPGEGYWVKMDTADTVILEGMAVGSPATLDLFEGYNLVSNPFGVAIDWSTVTLDGELITDIPGVMAFSYFGGAYQMVDFTTDSMDPGQGFWLLLNADATIEFTAP